MAKSLYLKMAINNIKQNRKFYIPYIVSAIGMVMVFYIMNYLSLYQGLNQMKGTQYIQTILFFGNIVIGIISIIFLFYINSFLMKRRKKEIGLYCVLGLEKKHIGFIMSLEKILTALIIIIGEVASCKSLP